MAQKSKSKHIKLTSHPGVGAQPIAINWGAQDPMVRRPIIGTLPQPDHRDVLGALSGRYAVERALAVAAGALDPQPVPDLTNTAPSQLLGPDLAWFVPERIVSLDPFGAVVEQDCRPYLEKGSD